MLQIITNHIMIITVHNFQLLINVINEVLKNNDSVCTVKVMHIETAIIATF